MVTMRKCLIVCYGYFGDHLFANSIAEHLIKENKFDIVDYVVGFPQVIPFFERNPFVNKIYFEAVGPHPRVPNQHNEYDKVFQLGTLSLRVPPTVEMQLLCGVKNPSPHFYIHTNPELDVVVEEYFKEVRTDSDAPILGIMSGWEERTFVFTKEEYARGIDVPNKGYGGKNRDVQYITEQLEQVFNTVLVGASKNVNQFTVNHNGQSLDLTASLIKGCDFFIGAEGGLANIAYAVGTKTILTSDFVYQLYGPNGVIRKNENPQLGPRFYTTDSNKHIDLDPYLSDKEVAESIINIITNNQ